MKKLLLSSVAFASLTAGAMAADLPSRRVAPAPFVAVPVFTWTGFYVGVNAGYGFNTGPRRNNVFTVTNPGTVTPNAFPAGTVVTTGGGFSDENDGFVGGGQIGYNYQIGSIVIGIEADAQYADFGGRRNRGTTFITPAIPGAPGAAGFFGGQNNTTGIDYFGTVRGRLGFAMDRALIYVTGGLAYSDGPGRDRCVVAATGFVVTAGACGANNDDFRTGYAVGGGVEYAFTPNLSGKIEGLYVDLERNRQNNFLGVVGGAGGPNGVPVFRTSGRNNNSDEFVVVRAGLNYKFNLF
jgi:outer membrane immunogenic protein